MLYLNWNLSALDTINALINFLSLFVLVPKLRNQKNILLVILISLSAGVFNHHFIGWIITIGAELFILRNESFKWTNKINLTFISIFITVFTQWLAFKFVESLLVFNNQIFTIILVSIINLLLTLGLICLGKYLIRRYLKNVPLNDTIVSSMNLISLTIILIGTLSLIMVSHYIPSQELFLGTTIITIVILIVLTFLGSTRLVSERLKKLQADYALEKMTESNLYINELEKNYNELRRFKHDYKNLLLSLSATLDNNASPETIEKILKSADVDLNTNFKLKNEQPFKIKNELIRGIVITKSIAAQKYHIKLTTKIEDDIVIDSNYSVNLTRVLGIIFDNAIEAVKNLDEPQMTFSLLTTRNGYQFSLQNKTAPAEINLKSIYKNGYSTKNDHSGLGLVTVKKIIDSYPNFQLKTTWHDNIFTININVEEQ